MSKIYVICLRVILTQVAEWEKKRCRETNRTMHKTQYKKQKTLDFNKNHMGCGCERGWIGTGREEEQKISETNRKQNKICKFKPYLNIFFT